MKVNVLYESRTGNTKLLADLIRKNYEGSLVSTPDEADLVFLGSWIDRGEMAASMRKAASAIHGKKVFLFGTCGAADPEYFQQLFLRAKSLLDESNHVVGHFYCQGKMPLRFRESYITMLESRPDDPKVLDRIKNFDLALHHPNKQDLTALQQVLDSLPL